MSIHRAWTLERVAAEERRQEAELAKQWQDLTFQPQRHTYNDPAVFIHNIVPCHERLYKTKIHPKPSGYRPPPEPVLLDKPVISETSKRLAHGRGGRVHDRLLPPKPVAAPPKVKVPDGIPETAERLCKPAERKFRHAIEEPTFRPNIAHQPLFKPALSQSKKPVLDRVYTKPKNAPA